MPSITKNKAAIYNYQPLETYEAGIVLAGPEVKAVKTGHINLKGSYVTIRGNEAWLINSHISPYRMARQHDYQPTRDRKLILHRKEINSLIGKLKIKGLTILPISVYTKGSFIKIEIALCRGKRLHDKRESIKKRESDRNIRRLMRHKK